jgi:lantibiotic biosynthesis protein
MGKRTAYAPYEHFMLRAPLLPVGLLSSIPHTTDQLFPWLKELWNQDIIREGIILGSFDLSQRIDLEFNRKGSVLPDPGVMYSLLRYLCRYSSRCTPFGTFAGFSPGCMGAETKVSLVQSAQHKLHARLDMEYLAGIARLLSADILIREKLLFSGNTTLYRVGSRWHYVEVRIKPGKSGKYYDIVTIDDGGIVGAILEFCRDGKSLSQIRDHLITRGWAENEVKEYVESLADAQIIVTGLEPVICGPEYIDCLLSELGRDFSSHHIVSSLAELSLLLTRMTRPLSILANLHRIEPITRAITVPLNRNHLIQVDTLLDATTITSDARLAGQVLLGLRIIKALAPTRRSDVMKGFREAFVKRYGDRKVLLVKALDPETGIGLEGSVEGYWTDPVPWIEDLGWGPGARTVATVNNPGHSWLVKKYYQSIRDGDQYLNLDSTDLQSIQIHEGNWPVQMTAIVELFESEIPGDPGIHFLSGSAGNPAYLLARFGFADPGVTNDWINQLIGDEQADSPDCLFAEVVHLPEDRTGNVLQRPSFLQNEIPYLARSVKAGEFRIPVTELMISVENESVVITSSVSGRRIHPCMTSAYNHQLGNLAVYKLLHRIQYQDIVPGYSPDWGDAVARAPFIPGITFGKLILSHPAWILHCSEIAGWLHPERNEADIHHLCSWKNDRKMPDEMIWMDWDQELYFNWNNANLMLALWDAIRGLGSVRVRPFYLSGGTPVKSPDGSHANQFVFCFHKS